MFWWILVIVSVIASIVAWIGYAKSFFMDNIVAIVLTGVAVFTFFGVAVANIICSIDYNAEIEKFIQQKRYIEEVVPTLAETDNYAITLKRIELNDWLYGVKYNYEHYAFFCFIPDKVMDLEEIK